MIAQAGGLTYSLPQRQQFAQPQPEMQQQAQQGSPFSAPIGEDLAYVEDLTNNYYNAYGRMKDFTETMWKDYGVDVTKPDFAQPGGGLMHQAFQKMDADLRMTANDLSQERKIREEQRKAVLEGKAVYAPGYQEEAQLARTLPQEQRIISLELFPEVEQALQGVSNRVYNTPTEREAAFATLKPMIAKYEQLKIDDPQNARRYQRQIDALRKPTYSLPDVSFRPPSGTGAPTGLIESLKKPVFDNMGFWTPQRTQTKVVNGQATVTMTPEQDVNHGPIKIETYNAKGKKEELNTNLIVDYYYLNDGQVMARYKSPANDPKYDRRVDNKLVSEQVRQQYGEDAKLMRDFYTATSDIVTPETGAVTVESFLKPEEIQMGEQNKQNAQVLAKQADAALAAEKNKIKEDMSEASGYKDLVFNINGKEYRFKNHTIGAEYYPENELKDIIELTGIPQPTLEGYKKDRLTADDIFKLLEKAGYFDQVVQKAMPQQAVPSSANTTTLPAEQSKFLRK
jgi:hypothetical protein